MKIRPKAIYAGTFDPFTNGHYDIALRAINIFGSLLIVVAAPDGKKPFLMPDKRVEIISRIFEGKEGVIRVTKWNRLIVDFAHEQGIKILVRGLRPTGDFDSEFQMAAMNRNLKKGVETVFITTSNQSYYISSSLVKEIFQYGGDVSSFVSPIAQEEMKKINNNA